MTSLRAQFGNPTGVLGSLVGMLMAIKNGQRSAWVLAQVEMQADDRVLEIGFGPGVDIARAAARSAFVAGVDMSDVMLRQASRRNADAIRRGRIDLRRATMPALPFIDASFDRAYWINSFQFWPEKIRSLVEIRRVMRSGGRVVIAVQPRNAGATDATSRQTGAEIVRTMQSAGLRDVRLLLKPMAPVATACAVATV